MNALAVLVRQTAHVGSRQGVEADLVRLVVADAILQPDRELGRLLVEQHVDLAPEAARGPAEMSFEDLPDVHAGGDPQGIQHHVHRGPVLQVRHVLFRQDA